MKSNNHLCWFCKSRNGTEKSNLSEPFYKIIKRHTNILGRVKTSYTTIKIEIPRCPTCCSRHDHVAINGFVVGLFANIIVAFILSYFFLGDISSMVITLILPGILIVAGVIYLFQNIKTLDTREENYKEKYPQIRELRVKGWVMGERPPYKGSDVN